MQISVVTGGGGFLGKAIVARLVERGDRVTSISRGFYPKLERMGVVQVQADITDHTAVSTAVRGADCVYHVAAKAGVWGRFREYHRVNVTGTGAVIRACLDNGVPRLVYTSSPSVVFDGGDMEGVDESVPYPGRYHAPYPETKALAEKMVRNAGAQTLGNHTLGTISLRPHLIWGPGDNHLYPRIIQRAARLRRIGDGKNRVDTIYVDNAAEAHLLADSALSANPALSGNVYFISQDEPVPLWDMVDDLLATAGLPPVKKTVSPRAAWAAGRLLETLYTVLGVTREPPMTGFVARELATSHWFDISRAKADLGYRPVVSTRQGLELLKHWYYSGGINDRA